MLDKNNGLPLYQSVRQQLRADLERERWKPGDMLPPEAELARHFGISIGTIRQAVLELVREGLLVRQPGRGTFVARLDARGGFGRFFHFREDLRGKVVPIVSHVDTLVMAEGDPMIASRLRIAPRAPICRIRRILLGGGDPICLYVSYLDLQRFPRVEALDLQGSRLYAVLEREYGTYVAKVEEILSAGVSTAEDAALLGIRAGTPVIDIERTAYGNQESVIEWRRTIGRSDQLRYKITLP